MIVLDSDHVSALQHRDSPAAWRLAQELDASGEEMATTIVTVEEQLRGWLAAIHRSPNPLHQIEAYRRLARLFEFFASWTLLPLDEDAAEEFHRLRRAGVRIGSMDLKIACIAEIRDALLLSRNLADFRKVPGLRVQDWLSTGVKG
jgi:tRNA(fMet)-specific endonuclease VapC